jgi:hypothetical protein
MMEALRKHYSREGFGRMVEDPEMPRSAVRVFSSAPGGPVAEIANLGVPAEAMSLCDRCGEALAPGDWPFCPHGRGKYSFRMR